jgi:acid phosphatase
VCLLVLCMAGCRTPTGAGAEPPLASHEGLNATLWLQSSAEYRANALQAFAAASAQLERALADPGWTAALEQTGDPAGLPPAIVLDMDEAVVRSDRFQAHLVEAGVPFRIEDWNAWVRSRDAEAVPGAVDYVRRASERGVRIFYVTNRMAEVEADSLATLRAAGFPVERGAEDVLSQDERPEWVADKSSRRAFLCRSHRVVQIVGDNLNDFVTGSEVALAGRQALVERHASFWGSRWIILPNPAYGSWEGAIHGYDSSLPRQEILRRKYELLDAWR